MLGDTLKKHRTLAGLTQKELADKLGFGVVSVQNWESGKFVPDIAKGKKICDFFSLSLDELYLGEKRHFLSRKYRNLSEHEITTALEYLDRIKEVDAEGFDNAMSVIFRADGWAKLKKRSGNDSTGNVESTNKG